MASRTMTLCALAFAISAPALRAEEPPLAGRVASQPASTAQPTPTPPDLGNTRLLFAPTARSPRRGSGAAGVTEVLFPWVQAAVTDRVSVLGFGVPVEGGGVAIAPQIQLYRNTRVQAAVGIAHLLALQGDSGGVGYGVLTLGGVDLGVTLGYGYGYGSLADSEGPRGVLFLGVEKALGRGFRLIGEGYLGGDALGLPDQTIAAGVRFNRGRWWADLGVVVPIYETGSGTPAPLLTVGRAF